jgi:Flp pilus assembly protein TadG
MSDDEGAAVVDFVLVTVLLLALFLAVFQVGLMFHVRNVIASAAAEGARFGAAANRTPAQGAVRAQQAVRDALGRRTAAGIRCSAGRTTVVSGARVVDVMCAGRVPIVFGPSPRISLTVHGHALEESR